MTPQLAGREPDTALVYRGVERVALVERFHFWAFLGVFVFLCPSSIAALVLLPLRKSVDRVDLGTPTVWLAVGLALAVPLAVRYAPELYWRLRRHPWLEVLPVALAACLIAYPLRSELWWPACTLLMLVATIASLRRELLYVLAVLAANLAAHTVAGDLRETPAVSILGLWIGFFFWTAVASVFTERFGMHVLTLKANMPQPTLPEPPQPTVVVNHAAASQPRTVDDPVPPMPSDPVPRTPVDGELSRLTVRQLEVIVLLADGLRYQEVADCLSISTRQVQRHVADAVVRAGVRNANQLTALAVSAGLVNHEDRAAVRDRHTP